MQDLHVRREYDSFVEESEEINIAFRYVGEIIFYH